MLPSKISAIYPRDGFFVLPTKDYRESELLLFDSSVGPITLSLVHGLFMGVKVLFSGIVSTVELLTPSS